MSEWREYKLGELAEITSSKRIFYSDYVPDGIRFYRSKEIIEKSLGETNGEPLFISKEKYYEIKNNYGSPIDGDLLISAVGERAGVPYVVKNLGDFYFKDGNLIWLRNIKQDLDINFFCYWLKSYLGQMALDSIMIGSAQKALTIVGLKGLNIFIPNIDTQRSIASILTSLDDKIDLLHRQNATLEKMAETLFRKWFVEEADESWELKKLKEVVDIGIGRTPPRKEFHWFSKLITDVKWVSIKDLGDSGIFVFDTSEYLTEEAVDKFNIPSIPPDTVLLSFKMTLGRVAITTEYMLSNEAIAHFKFNEETPFPKEFLYFYLKTYPYETLGSTSSIVTSINSGMIKDMEIIIPDRKTLNKFEHQVIEIFNKIKSNQTQIRTLTALRDTLLSKLMCGEVIVMKE